MVGPWEHLGIGARGWGLRSAHVGFRLDPPVMCLEKHDLGMKFTWIFLDCGPVFLKVFSLQRLSCETHAPLGCIMILSVYRFSSSDGEFSLPSSDYK